MTKSMFLIAALAMPAIPMLPPRGEEPLSLKEEAMTLEYTASAGEAAIVIQAETETTLGELELRAPDGRRLMLMRSEAGQGLVLQGFVLETREGDPRVLFSDYPEGRYIMNGRTPEGFGVRGGAIFSHKLPAAPQIRYPLDGARHVPTDLKVSWQPDPAARGYRIGLEQGDSDTLAVTLPAEASSFKVPEGVLRSGTETQVEVGAIGVNGNCTIVEVEFTTR